MRLFPKLLLSFLAVALAGVLVVAVLANQTATREVQRFMFSGGMVPEQALAQGLAGYYRGHGSWDGVETILPRGPGHGPLGMGMMGRRLILTNAQNLVVGDSTGLALGQTFSAGETDSVLPVEVDSVRVGTLIAQGQLSLPGGPSTDLLIRVNRGIWLAALVAAMVALVMAGGLAYNLVRPIQNVTEAAGAIARGDLSQRVAVTARGEIGKLASAFNAMAADLEKAERLRRDMTADVAHELRNPLAVLQGNLEAVMDGILPPTSENLQPLLDQTLLLTRLVEDLRTLSLADAGQLRLDRVATDPAALMQSIVGQFSAQAKAQAITLRAEIDADLPLVTLEIGRAHV
jgi:signal transduction histidine kinase